MATHLIKYSVDGSGIQLEKTITSTASGVALIDGEQVTTATTDGPVNFDLDVSACVSFFLVSDQAITIETNATDATGGNTMVLRANEPYAWHTNSKDSFLFTEDIAIMYVTNASGATATIYCVALFDPSPA